MKTMVSANEVFALRDGERFTILEERPAQGTWLAVMARSVSMPEGERHPVRQFDGKAVEMAAVVACQVVEGKWQWCQLSAPTKEQLGDLLFDSGAARDRWYYILITQGR